MIVNYLKCVLICFGLFYHVNEVFNWLENVNVQMRFAWVKVNFMSHLKSKKKIAIKIGGNNSDDDAKQKKKRSYNQFNEAV